MKRRTPKKMGLDLIIRTLKTTAILLVIFFPFGIYYLGFYPSLAVFTGGVWGLFNLLFISALVRVTIRPGGVDKPKAIGIGLFKFPLLYVAGYFLLKAPIFDPLYLLIGFSSFFAVIILKVLGRLITGIHDNPGEDIHAEGAA
ncbi:MAG: hypothetical protein JSU65_06155 [Candidatus Zixiibacteriota bacterium]|nr:MAG: hypothetical protein JSU65_06155 [candidate division Zixibacteria bacterium]